MEEDGTMNDIAVQEVLNEKDIKRLLTSFHLSVGLVAVFYNADASYSIRPDGYDEICPFCALVQSFPEGKARCMQYMAKAGKQSADFGDSYISRCHGGMVEIFAPIMLRDVYLGFIACGPIAMWEWDEMAMNEITKRFQSLRIVPDALLEVASSIKVYSGKNVQALAEMLFMVANSLASADMLALQQRKELSVQQARIAELIFEKKMTGEATHTLEEKKDSGGYPLNKEKEMLGRVRLGDRTGAKEILNEILGEIFFHTGGDLEIIKARILELVVVLSRAAIEGGASLEKMLGSNLAIISELSGIREFDNLCLCVVRILDTIMDTIYLTSNVRNAKTLGNALSFIRENYYADLSLGTVANHVYINPFYLSHLFRNELGFTFMEYLTRVRMEEAKKLLSQPELTVVEIAGKVGYEDPGYFGKVFKKYHGITPIKYRQS